MKSTSSTNPRAPQSIARTHHRESKQGVKRIIITEKSLHAPALRRRKALRGIEQARQGHSRPRRQNQLEEEAVVVVARYLVVGGRRGVGLGSRRRGRLRLGRGSRLGLGFGLLGLDLLALDALDLAVEGAGESVFDDLGTRGVEAERGGRTGELAVGGQFRGRRSMGMDGNLRVEVALVSLLHDQAARLVLPGTVEAGQIKAARVGGNGRVVGGGGLAD